MTVTTGGRHSDASCFEVFVRNQREHVAAPRTELVLPRFAAAAIATPWGMALLMAAFLYLFPGEAIDIWPWPLTRLPARMLRAIFALGLAGLGAWRERRWSAARSLVQVAGIMVGLILVAGIRARSESSHPTCWRGCSRLGLA